MLTEEIYGLQTIDDIIRDIATGRESKNVRWESFSPLFIEYIRNAKVYVDCGAEYGFYIHLALKYGSKNLKIFAFEPEPRRYELLKQSMRAQKNVTIFPFAVADCKSVQKVVKPGVGISLSFQDYMHSDGYQTTVDAISIDEILPNLYADVVKMDIEGAEDLAFIGMQNMIKHSPSLTFFVEFHPAKDDAVREQICANLFESGFKLVQGNLDDIGCGRVVLSRVAQ